jgi:hypothetical protein
LRKCFYYSTRAKLQFRELKFIEVARAIFEN